MLKKYSMKPGIGIFALVLLIFSGCGWDGTAVENFDYDLRGTWVSTRTLGWWETEGKGKLVITYDTITITGSVLPFSTGYTKGVELEGYSEETSSDGVTERGTLFFKDIGGLKSVPYELLHAAHEDVLAVGTVPNLETFKRE
ncbi:hypothetical protein AGMMS49944_19440 [Spirochaetia bacterium]|nr:hypothetical protein AGMMS49944_19440 [Spirochaetia bacterium]